MGAKAVMKIGVKEAAYDGGAVDGTGVDTHIYAAFAFANVLFLLPVNMTDISVFAGSGDRSAAPAAPAGAVGDGAGSLVLFYGALCGNGVSCYLAVRQFRRMHSRRPEQEEEKRRKREIYNTFLKLYAKKKQMKMRTRRRRTERERQCKLFLSLLFCLLLLSPGPSRRRWRA